MEDLVHQTFFLDESNQATTEKRDQIMNDQQFNAILEALDNIAHMNADDRGGRAMLYKNGELEDGIPTDIGCPALHPRPTRADEQHTRADRQAT
jgi:hypothetical protein